jgi:sterol desaturase/sphingolipid hydroxylase (fatty acid hydroxylase superfamily)
MWAVHGFHHNPTRLHWLNGFRVNPLNLVWHQLAGLGVLVLIGAPEPLLQSVIAFGTVVGIFQHVNADLRFDGWNRIFSTADQHRWHHAADAGAALCNFGAVLMLWDQVFGTYRRERHGPTRVGVAGFEPAARGYLAGLVEAVRMTRRS